MNVALLLGLGVAALAVAARKKDDKAPTSPPTQSPPASRPQGWPPRPAAGTYEQRVYDATYCTMDPQFIRTVANEAQARQDYQTQARLEYAILNYSVLTDAQRAEVMQQMRLNPNCKG